MALNHLTYCFLRLFTEGISSFSPTKCWFPSPHRFFWSSWGHVGRRSPISQLPDVRLEKLREQEEAEQRRREAQAQHEQRMKRQESERWKCCSPASKLLAFPWNQLVKGLKLYQSFEEFLWGKLSQACLTRCDKGYSTAPCPSSVRKYTDLVFECSTVASESKTITDPSVSVTVFTRRHLSPGVDEDRQSVWKKNPKPLPKQKSGDEHLVSWVDDRKLVCWIGARVV